MKKCKIIMYHYVRPLQNSTYPDIKGLELDGFLRQIKYFQEKYQFVNSEQLLDSIYKNSNLSINSVSLTFDDGFKDHYSYVFPILKKFNIQGLFFPTAKPIEEHIVLDVHKIHFILACTLNKQEIINEIFNLINQYETEYNLQEPKSYYSTLAVSTRFDTADVIFIKRILQRELPKNIRKIIVDQLFKKFVSVDEQSFSKELYLSYEEIKEMNEAGMYFGSHGYAHNWLSYLSEIDLKNEIHKSRDFCKKINKNLNDLIMCYPYGDYNEKTIYELKKAGFKAGLATEVGDAKLDLLNAFSLKRFDTNDFPQ